MGFGCPMHEQPSWSLGKVAYRIASAAHVNSDQFKVITAYRGTNWMALPSSAGGCYPSEGRYAKALRSQFLACPSARPSAETLMLRGDLEEAYVVAEQR